MPREPAAVFALVNQGQTPKNTTDPKSPNNISLVEHIMQPGTTAKRSKRTERQTFLESADESASESNTNERMDTQPYQTALKLEWKVRKAQTKAMRMQKLASQY